MCGITGFLNAVKIESDEAFHRVSRMANTLRHRGPDDAGLWIDVEGGIALGHRRLSIVDLSPSGHQPMHSPSGRYVLVFNGEIYNHVDMRNDLGMQQSSSSLHFPWRGYSDTETLLAGFDYWGIEKTLNRCIGMFAIALWDRKEACLTLARDRLGEKPLYYGWQNGVFLFGSELKSLRAHPSFKNELDRGAVALFLRHNYVPAPYSIYHGVYKLPAGTWVCIKANNPHADLKPHTYWSLADVAENGQAEPFIATDSEAVDALDLILRDAVSRQMMADVPLGALLSGGVDSSTVVSLMQAQSHRPIKTFTIGFNEATFNEADHAKAVAMHLGTDHTELYVTPRQALDVIPRLPFLYDEPFADASQIPTFLVSQMARQHVTVALSGDAGDELFGGYNRYTVAAELLKARSRLPAGVRTVLANTIRMLPTGTWNLLGKLGKFPDASEKIRKICDVITASSQEEIYYRLVSNWNNPCDLVISAHEPPTMLSSTKAWPKLMQFEHQMMALDALSYLTDDVLVKVDRAAMGVSLESRLPFLDHRVVEFAWRLPLHQKIRNRQGKWVLRQVLYKYVPQALIDRPKKGFSVPIADWLRGPLREWGESLLGESRLQSEGIFHAAPIRRMWSEHLSGKRNSQYQLWSILMFQVWLEQERHE